mmetsp:Transcript_9185/g.16121  ORF Transcript_9185/g.16121 Transcript_9185/m.16121 type:complete len:116 (-) Transcript_9185:710-1057(-)
MDASDPAEAELLAVSASCSMNDASTLSSTLRLQNSAEHSVQLIWVSFDGEAQVYNLLAPGSSTSQETFSSHVWRLLDEEGRLLLQYSGPSASLHVRADGGVEVAVCASSPAVLVA